MLKNKTFSHILFVKIMVLLIVIFSCHGINYSIIAFSYPPGSKPHANDWEYFGKIVVSSHEKGPLYVKSKKTVNIKITNHKERVFLDEEFNYLCGSIDATITWDKFDNIEIFLFEVGNKFADDDYNKLLLNKGPTKIADFKYTFDKTLQKFKREN